MAHTTTGSDSLHDALDRRALLIDIAGMSRTEATADMHCAMRMARAARSPEERVRYYAAFTVYARALRASL